MVGLVPSCDDILSQDELDLICDGILPTLNVDILKSEIGISPYCTRVMLLTSYVWMVSASALCLAFRPVTDSSFCYFTVTLLYFLQLVYLCSIHVNMILH
jgi:hypothetical protein